MLVVHGLWSPGRGVLLWAEDGSRPTSSASRSLRSARPHPFAAPTATLATLHPGKPTTITLLLPSRSGGPLSSPELVRAARSTSSATRTPPVLRPWSVPALLVDASELNEAGRIVSMDVEVGAVRALVQGSRPKPYQVRIGITTFGKAEWAHLGQALVDDASLAAALLNGELPREIEALFDAAGLPLFPASARDLAMDCTCPDHQVPCEHLAAVCFVLAERFDADPFEILALRGRDREALQTDLRARRAAAAPAAPASGAPALDQLLDRFFVAGQGLDEQLAGPRTPPDVLLDQVPELAVDVRGHRVTDLLRPAYRALGQ